MSDPQQSADEIKKLITDNGGDTLTRMTAQVTHLVTVAGHAKIKDATKKNILCVSEEWIHESIAKKAKQDEKNFDLAGAGAKRGADDEESDAKGKGKRAKKAKDDAPAAPAAAPAPAAAAAPAAAPASPKADEEKKVKVIKKGKAPVDPTSGMVNSHHVHVDNDGTVWDCMLNQVSRPLCGTLTHHSSV